MKILDVMWFSSYGTVGIVRVSVPQEGIKYYIASCHGLDEQVDKKHIAAWGATFPNYAGDFLFGIQEDQK